MDSRLAEGLTMVEIRMRPPTLLDRLWYRRINETPPLSVGDSGPFGRKLARLVPYRFRRFHHAYATTFGFYWLPCPLCGREHGGHEGGKTIPDPIHGPLYGIVICSRCSHCHPDYPKDQP
ncbi:hypothetical protein IMZ11_02505 [Microtetraspora sp. AC03309]|uniref:hypothetical protein n=1 Tax=Microtetraspora sp. AC03309 TaxID=2779376 RepID=UPI001E3C16C7|nr:hypothetical protein [Microtetraspora sp. AC03309]MCC5574510.1 hypothetical protein [Microtetraspora sp. AC03309]